ncbi:MAG: hypothetical protein IKF17_04985 [Clostridia bacterium]|nr:hypothetical protein [Clostridia bacterium]
MKKAISNILFIVYAVIAIFVTVCLLSYNDYKVTEFGNNSLLLITDNSLEPRFKKGDLVIVDKSVKARTGRKAFFYEKGDTQIDVKLGTVEAMEKVTETETTYTFEGSLKKSSQYVIGTVDGAKVIPTVGGILSVLESKWGFLFLIVMPSLLAFIYQITVVVTEIRESKNN